VAPTSLGLRLLLLVIISLGICFASMPLIKAGLETALPGPQWLQELVRLEPGPGAQRMADTQAAAAYTYDIGRVSRRWLLLVGLGVFVGLRRWVPWGSLTKRAFRRTPQRWANLRFGIFVGLVMVAAYASILIATGTVSRTGVGFLNLAGRSVDLILGALFAALLEEYLFRGVFFRGMLRDWGSTVAIAVSGSLFAILHCINGGFRVEPGWDPTVGYRLFAMYFMTDGSPLPDLRLMVGLFLFAWLLAYLYLRTGTIWAPLGLHWGIVFGSKLMKKIFDRVPDFPEWLLGDSRFLVSGVATWALLLVTIAIMTMIAPKGPLYRRIERRKSRLRIAD
jgi:membrane protease YdiL (CAAX protease family)